MSPPRLLQDHSTSGERECMALVNNRAVYGEGSVNGSDAFLHWDEPLQSGLGAAVQSQEDHQG